MRLRRGRRRRPEVSKSIARSARTVCCGCARSRRTIKGDLRSEVGGAPRSAGFRFSRWSMRLADGLEHSLEHVTSVFSTNAMRQQSTAFTHSGRPHVTASRGEYHFRRLAMPKSPLGEAPLFGSKPIKQSRHIQYYLRDMPKGICYWRMHNHESPSALRSLILTPPAALSTSFQSQGKRPSGKAEPSIASNFCRSRTVTYAISASANCWPIHIRGPALKGR